MKAIPRQLLDCVKFVRIRSYSGPHISRIFAHSDYIWIDTPISLYSVRKEENAVKMQTRMTPNTDTFRSVSVA